MSATEHLYDDEHDLALERLMVGLAREIALTRRTLAVARSAQWQTSPVPRPAEDTTERAKGGHGDPTPSVALDTRRLRLRTAVIASERSLDAVLAALAETREGLERSFSRWEGSAD